MWMWASLAGVGWARLHFLGFAIGLSALVQIYIPWAPQVVMGTFQSDTGLKHVGRWAFPASSHNASGEFLNCFLWRMQLHGHLLE